MQEIVYSIGRAYGVLRFSAYKYPLDIELTALKINNSFR